MFGPEFWEQSDEPRENTVIAQARTYRHAEQPGTIMRYRKVLVGEFRAPVDREATSSISVHKIAALDHEVFDLENRQLPAVDTPSSGLAMYTTRWNLLPL